MVNTIPAIFTLLDALVVISKTEPLPSFLMMLEIALEPANEMVAGLMARRTLLDSVKPSIVIPSKLSEPAVASMRETGNSPWLSLPRIDTLVSVSVALSDTRNIPRPSVADTVTLNLMVESDVDTSKSPVPIVNVYAPDVVAMRMVVFLASSPSPEALPSIFSSLLISTTPAYAVSKVSSEIEIALMVLS